MSHVKNVFIHILTHTTKAKQLYDCFRACRHTAGHRTRLYVTLAALIWFLEEADTLSQPRVQNEESNICLYLYMEDVKQMLFIFEKWKEAASKV